MEKLETSVITLIVAPRVSDDSKPSKKEEPKEEEGDDTETD